MEAKSQTVAPQALPRSTMADGISQIRTMAYGRASAAPTGTGIGNVSRPTKLIVRKSRPKRLVTALRRGFGLG